MDLTINKPYNEGLKLTIYSKILQNNCVCHFSVVPILYRTHRYKSSGTFTQDTYAVSMVTYWMNHISNIKGYFWGSSAPKPR